ncbi:hypothetical protein HRbin14_01606 [bacterium HR14]|nr:hypothetical protein HRbin14_01606 [bacterium HR14]
MPTLLLRWLAWVLALWLMGAPVAVVAGCLYACDLQPVLCCRSEPASESLAAPEADKCAGCAVCHPRTPQQGDLPHKLTPLISLTATPVAKPAILSPLTRHAVRWVEVPLKFPLYKHAPEAPRAPPVASSC